MNADDPFVATVMASQRSSPVKRFGPKSTLVVNSPSFTGTVRTVLLAMGLPRERARSAVRFSLGASNTEADLEPILDALVKVVGRLRSFAGS